MPLSNTNVIQDYVGVIAGTPINVPIAAYTADVMYVYYGDGLEAVQGVDYAIALDEPPPGPLPPDGTNWQFVIITPAASLITKMDVAGVPHDIRVLRDMPDTTDFSETDAFFRDKISREFTKTNMKLGELTVGQDTLITAADSADAAAASAAAAAASAVDADASADGADTSEANALASANAANASQIAAAASATAASGSATSASGSASAAATSATNAGNSATAAAGSASAAATSATNANNSAVAAAGSAASAAASASLFPVLSGIADANKQLVVNSLGTAYTLNPPGSINIVTDTSPELGGNLDTNTFDIWFDDAKGIRDSNGNEHLIFQEVASAANYWEMENAAAGSPVRLRATGSDATVPMVLETKGATSIIMSPGNVRQFSVTYVASAVNWVSVFGAAATGTVGVSATGSDADVGLILQSQGTDGVILATNSGAQIQAQAWHVASAVNHVALRGSAAGNPTSVASAGADPNISMMIGTKGTGVVSFAPGFVEGMRVSPVAGAVNYLDAKGSVAGSGVSLGAGGTDANIATIIGSKANPVIIAPGFVEGMRVSYLVGGNQYVNVMGGIDAGTVPSIQVSGTGTNIDLAILGKGTGGAIVTHKNVGGLLLKDSDNSHTLAVNATSNLTANRTLSIITGDADRTLDLTGGGGFQPADATLTALAALNATAGILVQTAADTFTKRTMVASGVGVFVTDGDGVAGPPTVALNALLQDISQLSSTGILAKIAATDVVERTITGTSPVTVTNGNGVAGNPTLALDNTALLALIKTLLPYEEGTFVPALTFGGAAVGLTYTSRNGAYTRIGNRVFFDLAIVLSSKGSSSGAAIVGGFTIPINQASIAVSVRVTNITAGIADQFVQAVYDQGQAGIWLRRYGANGTADGGWDNTHFSNTTNLQVSGHYMC